MIHCITYIHYNSIFRLDSSEKPAKLNVIWSKGMMEIGVISDTHGRLSPKVLPALKGVDLILHAGDIGEAEILEKLKEISPVQAVYGNTDIYSLASILPSTIEIKLEKLTAVLTHNIGSIQHFIWKRYKHHRFKIPDIVVFGHTHTPCFEYHQNVLFVNPGSASLPRQGNAATVLRFKVADSDIVEHNLIKL